MPQRVLQQRTKNVVEAGEESWVRRGLPGPRNTDMRQHIIKKTVHRQDACAFSVAETVTVGRDRGRGRDRDRGRDR